MEERRHCSKYTLTLTWFKSAISIPPELDGPETFHPTVGPKVLYERLRDLNCTLLRKAFLFFLTFEWAL
jgi:hypothetical protein